MMVLLSLETYLFSSDSEKKFAEKCQENLLGNNSGHVHPL